MAKIGIECTESRKQVGLKGEGVWKSRCELVINVGVLERKPRLLNPSQLSGKMPSLETIG